MKNLNITEIENLKYEEVRENALEKLTIKDHDCFLVDFGGYFGYSILVFKNKKHIHYANDFELHHHYLVKKEGIEGLKQYYIKEMNKKLYTDAELLEPCKSYEEYKAKDYFLRNYWMMRYEHESIFFIGTDAEREERKKEIDFKYPFFNPVCFCYVADKKIVEDAENYLTALDKSFHALQDDEEAFREMIKYELSNHEACITCDYTDALAALGMSFDRLSDDKKQIVKEELKKQIEAYCQEENYERKKFQY